MDQMLELFVMDSSHDLTDDYGITVSRSPEEELAYWGIVLLLHVLVAFILSYLWNLLSTTLGLPPLPWWCFFVMSVTLHILILKHSQ